MEGVGEGDPRIVCNTGVTKSLYPVLGVLFPEVQYAPH